MAAYVLEGTHSEFLRLRTADETGDYRMLQGVVTNFVPEGNGGHPMERFTLQGVTFSYSTYDGTSAFHLTARHGGPMRDGLSVRLAEHNGRILRLEIAGP